ncbi:MAG: transposase [Muribaculaceae bacterium]|nr:transposase [Muribaculaceae bacterium]
MPPDLYRYIWGIIRNHGCKLYRIGGIENHIHMLIDLNPMISLSSFVKEIKRCSNLWIKDSLEKYPAYKGWARGYYAFSVNYRDRQKVIDYIISQPEHHKVTDSEKELENLLQSEGLSDD